MSNPPPQHAEMPDTGASGAARRGVAIWAGVFLLSVIVAASVGGSGPSQTVRVLLSVLDNWLRAGWAPALFLLASYGLGRAFERWIKPSPDRALLQLTLGLALALSLTHLLGVLALLRPSTSFALVALGVALALHQLLRSGAHKRQVSLPRVSPWALLLAPPIALGCVAVCAPPGWLWGSEYGSFDALSYHLQLPKEWLGSGRVWPVEHNVYSFLPSYLESASVLLAHLTLAPMDAGLTAGSGWRALMPQLLHWQVTLLAAVAVARVTVSLALQIPAYADSPRARTAAGFIAGAVTLATPWVLVVGTIAYNEMAVVMLGAAGMLAALDDRLAPVSRTALAAFLVGVACSVKPTAILFVAPVVGVVVVWRVPRRWLVPAITIGVLVGLVTLAPWLVRNHLASGNPVFPALSSVFSPAHYDSAALARYADAHTYHGSVLDRLRLLVWYDPAAPPSAATVAVWRGLSNSQWGLLGFAAPFAIALACFRQTRKVGIALTIALLLQLLAWLLLTHLQSRFLIPCILTLVPAVGLMWAHVVIDPVLFGKSRPRVARAGVVAFVLVQTAFSFGVFRSERSGNPNLATPFVLSLELGRSDAPGLAETFPSAYINTRLPPGSLVYLLGDSTPFFYETPVLYNTTYDPWPLAQAIHENPDRPDAWTTHLRSLGVTHVLVAPSELARLNDSGWIDPALTPQRVRAWLDSLPPHLHYWSTESTPLSRALYRLTHTEDPSP